ncbi:MAG: hypothetical protein REDVDVYQ_001198 [Candidatus Fervidibacter sp.]
MGTTPVTLHKCKRVVRKSSETKSQSPRTDNRKVSNRKVSLMPQIPRKAMKAQRAFQKRFACPQKVIAKAMRVSEPSPSPNKLPGEGRKTFPFVAHSAKRVSYCFWKC